MVEGNQIVEEAKQHWEAGRALDAGRILFEHLPESSRPGWAAGILAIAAGHFPKVSEVENVLATAEAVDPTVWLGAKEIFHQVRALTLRTERQGQPGHQEHQAQLCFLLLAENTAKLTYNSFRQPGWVEDLAPPLPRFDADAGWWIAANIRCIADALGDRGFTDAAWSALVAPYQT
jgi:hypothetical protein